VGGCDIQNPENTSAGSFGGVFPVYFEKLLSSDRDEFLESRKTHVYLLIGTVLKKNCLDSDEWGCSFGVHSNIQLQLGVSIGSPRMALNQRVL
jgi:hypothetical protein